TFTRWSTGQPMNRYRGTDRPTVRGDEAGVHIPKRQLISDKGSVMTSRNPVAPKLLALGVSVSALLPASGVHSEVSSLLGVAPTQYCERWRDNALLGARQQLRGASREIQYVNVATQGSPPQRVAQSVSTVSSRSEWSPSDEPSATRVPRHRAGPP